MKDLCILCGKNDREVVLMKLQTASKKGIFFICNFCTEDINNQFNTPKEHE